MWYKIFKPFGVAALKLFSKNCLKVLIILFCENNAKI